MVEFGLKLEDNKVADWSDHYIDYEKLKAILKKAKNAIKKRDDLMKRRPELAEEIREAYEAGKAALYKESSRSSSAATLNALVGGGKEGNEDRNSDDDTEAKISMGTPKIGSTRTRSSSYDEKAGLLQKDSTNASLSKKYGSDTDATDVPVKADHGSNTSLNSLAGGLTHSTSHGSLQFLDKNDSFSRQTSDISFNIFSGYFSKNKYEQRLRESFSYVDYQHEKFGKVLDEEVVKVNNFYNNKTTELDGRLQMLLDSVNSSENLKFLKKLSLIDDQSSSGGGKRIQTLKNILKSKIGGGRRSSLKSKSSDAFDAEMLMDEDIMSDDEDDRYHVKKADRIRETDSVKRAIEDQYRTAKLLHNFSVVNYTGFVKIVKKHDKTFTDKKGVYKHVTKESNICDEGNAAEDLILRMEKMFARWFCGGNLREAQAQMLRKRGDGLEMDWSQLRLGYRLGMCSILAVWVCWDCVWGLVRDGNSTIGGRTAFPVFRACGGLLLLHWCWGFSVYVWSRYRINYIFLFDFNPKVVDSSIKIFNDTVDETLVFLVTMLLYYKSGANDIPEIMPPGVYPFILVMYTIKNLLFPWKTRSAMWKAVWEVITSPLHSPTFFTVYCADVFTSMVKVFQDIAWTIGFVVSGDFLASEDKHQIAIHDWQHSVFYKNFLIPLICLLPLWFRFNQCLRKYLDTGSRFPNLANAFKYAMSQTVTLFGAFHPLYLMAGGHEVGNGVSLFQFFWMALFVASSLYSFTWDVYMDWGLGRPEHNFLGPRLMFPNRLYYYGVIAADLVLRSMWVLSLIPPQSGAKFEIPAYLTAVTMSLELLRRTLWAFFRLENEHRHNTEHFRRVSFVPLHFSTGHQHKYKEEKEHKGNRVLAEVAFVSLLVIAISVTSVIAAQRATSRTMTTAEL